MHKTLTILLLVTTFLFSKGDSYSSPRTVTLNDGTLVKVTDDKIWDWKKKCKKGSADACYKVGLVWGDKNAVERLNQAEGFKYMKRACRRNHPVACYNLGIMYIVGKGTGKNIRRAKINLEMASQLNVDGAEEALALLPSIN